MQQLNCINIMPSNDHYARQNSHDNKAITILRAQLPTVAPFLVL